MLNMERERIALIVQRYGLEVNGGAEYHCRILAEQLKSVYDVTVLTSCAQDYRTWENEYAAGKEVINGVEVIRFPTAIPRDSRKFRSLSRKFANRKPYQKVLKALGLLKAYKKLVSSQVTEEDCYNWAKYQGPYMPELIPYLEAEQDRYQVFIFFTYLYYPTIYGLDVNPGKSILIPTAHDEPPIYFPVFKDLFAKPRAILYNTLAEKRFVNGQFHNEEVHSEITGIGIERTEPVVRYNSAQLLNDTKPYLIYIGRIDASKGCKLMCDYFLRYINDAPDSWNLVLVGQAFMEIPVHPAIIAMGFVEEDVKLSLLEDAEALIIPSFYESLSMVTLESMAHGIPVVANGNCEVLKDHIDQSGAGFAFTDYESFKLAMDALSDPEFNLPAMQKRAVAYVADNYNWQVVVEKIQSTISFVADQSVS